MILARLCKVRHLGQKACARMYGVNVGYIRRADNIKQAQVALRFGAWANALSLIRVIDVH